MQRSRPKGAWTSSQYRWSLAPRGGAVGRGRGAGRAGAPVAGGLRPGVGRRTSVVGGLDGGGDEAGAGRRRRRRAADPVADPGRGRPSCRRSTRRRWGGRSGAGTSAISGPSSSTATATPGPSVWCRGRVVGGWAHRADGEVAYKLLRRLGTARTGAGRGGGGAPAVVARRRRRDRQAAVPDARCTRSCRREPEAKPTRRRSSLELDGREVTISSPDKVFFEERGETKLDLVEFYEAVRDPLLAAMGGRPVLLQRFPEGADGQLVLPEAGRRSRSPPWLQTTVVSTPNGTTSDALVAADLAHVAWAVNIGLPRLPRVAGPRRRPRATPTSCASTSTRRRASTFPMVREAALRGAGRCSRSSASSAGPKTTGNRGIHVYLRLEPRWDSYDVRAAAVALARELERRHPDLHHRGVVEGGARARASSSTSTRTRRTRPCSGRGACGPGPGAQVSTPFRWDELDEAFHPDRFTIAGRGRAGRRAAATRGPAMYERAAVARAAAGDVGARPGGRAAWTRRGRRCTRSSRTSRRGWRRAGRRRPSRTAAAGEGAVVDRRELARKACIGVRDAEPRRRRRAGDRGRSRARTTHLPAPTRRSAPSRSRSSRPRRRRSLGRRCRSA